METDIASLVRDFKCFLHLHVLRYIYIYIYIYSFKQWFSFYVRTRNFRMCSSFVIGTKPKSCELLWPIQWKWLGSVFGQSVEWNQKPAQILAVYTAPSRSRFLLSVYVPDDGRKESFRNLLCLNKTKRRYKEPNLHLMNPLIKIYLSALHTQLSKFSTCETTSRTSIDYKSLCRNTSRCIRESSPAVLLI